jgi:trehalose/maltose hydrolase-like predicted phosphorylase
VSDALQGWSLVEAAFDVRHNRHYEGLFTIGSGPLQQRAALEEGLCDDPQDRTYLRLMGNVSVETPPPGKSRVGTYLPGVSGPHPTCGDQMINLPAIHGLVLFAAGERLDMERGPICNYSRTLDLRTGHLLRQFTWHTRGGAILRVSFERFISAARRHVMALRCTVQHVGGAPVELRFVGSLSAEVCTNGFDHFTAVEITGEHEPITLAARTNSGIDVAAAAILTSDRPIAWNVESEPRWVALTGTRTLDPGQSLSVYKFAALTSSRHVNGSPVDAARNLVWAAAAAGFARLAEESDAVWAQRWAQSDVVIEGDPRSQLALRAGLYHLLRAAVEDDPRCAIDARAASGEAYCGRYFWDTEIFLLPFFLYTRPRVGQTLARFRLVTLDGARRNAQAYGYPGARYAWESSPTGDEHCPNWQYRDHEVHVTADVAYGLWHAHLACPQDVDFLHDVVEALTEMARYWSVRVTPRLAEDGYELLGVMGPDEYTPFSRNNAYTNRLVAFALRLTGFAWEKLARAAPARAEALRERLRLERSELERFEVIATKLRMPYDAQRRLVLQADDFFRLEPFDFERWWPDRTQPVGRCVSQERLYRSQVLKQADVLQLMALFPQEFEAEQMRVAYDTYAPLTSHDSSLSRPIHALIASWLGRADEAFALWQQAVGLDLEPPAASEGVHAGCAGACWQVAVLGFAGLRTRMQSEILCVEPRLPRTWSAVRFPFVWEGQSLRVAVERDRVTIEHEGDRVLPARIAGRLQELAPGRAHSFPVRAET